MTTLNYDANGFILGVDRMSKGIDNVHDDTQEIIQILKSQNQIGNTRMAELTRAVKAASYRTASQASNDTSRARSNSSDRRPRISPTPSSNQDSTNSNRPSNRSPISRNSANADDRARTRTRSGTPASDTDTNNGSSSRTANNGPRERDANGRFISENSSSGARSFGGAGMGSLGSSNVGGVDPVLDSLKEAKDLLSPLGRGAKLAGRATKFSWSKIKSMKRREPLSNDETRHNRENEKLLDKIWKAIKKSGGSGGAGRNGLLGGLLGGAAAGGGLLKKIGKMKFLGPLAALAGAGSLAMDWDALDHEGKSEGVGGLAGAGAGGLAGMKLGAMAGAIGGPIGVAIGGTVGAVAGAWLGSEGGEALGSAASPYIDDWTNSIVAYNLPKKMGKTWEDGIKPFFKRMDSLAGRLNTWLEGKMSDIGDGVSSTGAGLAEALGLADLGSVAQKYESGGRGVETISTGKGDHGGVSYGTHQLASKTGSMAAYLNSPEGKQFAGEFAGKSAGSSGFNAKYKDVVSRRGDEFKKSQKDYITRTHYMPAKEKAEKYGFDTNNRGIQEAIYSHGTQYGPGHESRFKRVAASGVNMKDNQAVLKAFYADKAAYVNQDFKSSSSSVRAGMVKNRIPSELADVLAISKVSSVKNTVKDVAASVVDTAKESVTAPTPSKNSKTAKTPKAKSGNGILGFSMNELNSETVNPTTNNLSESSVTNTPFMPESYSPLVLKPSKNPDSVIGRGYAPANLPASPMLKIPNLPKIKERLDSGGSNKPIMLQSSNDTINQNLSDRGLSHAVTGGLGQDRYWG